MTPARLKEIRAHARTTYMRELVQEVDRLLVRNYQLDRALRHVAAKPGVRLVMESWWLIEVLRLLAEES